MKEFLYSHFKDSEEYEIAGIPIEYHCLKKTLDSSELIEEGHVYNRDNKKYLGVITKSSLFVTYVHYPSEAEYNGSDIETALSQAFK